MVLNSTGQKLTSPRRIALLELKETAATFTKGSRHIRLKIRITIIRTICPGVQIDLFFSVITLLLLLLIAVIAPPPPYQIPSSPSFLVTRFALVIRIMPTTDWNRPMAVARANWLLVMPAR